MTTPPIHLTTDELAARWRLHPGTLRNWRAQGRGPGFMRLGSRVLYSMAEVERVEIAGALPATIATSSATSAPDANP